MADIVKKVSRTLPISERILKVTEADATAGDVIMVRESLGRPADNILIDATAAITIRFNVYHTVYPASQTPYGAPNLGAGVRVIDDTTALVELEAGEAFEASGDFPIVDIQIISGGTDFEIFLT